MFPSLTFANLFFKKIRKDNDTIEENDYSQFRSLISNFVVSGDASEVQTDKEVVSRLEFWNFWFEKGSKNALITPSK